MAEAPAPASNGAPSLRGGLALAAAIVAFGFIGSRFLGVIRTSAVANAFGSGPELDAYLVAFRIPDLIFQVLAGATLASAFIPVFSRVIRRDGEERAWQLASASLNLIVLATAALCVVAFILAPWLVPLTAPGLELESKAVSLTRLMLLSPLIFAASGMVTGILNARQRFLLAALAPMLYNLAIIFGALVLAGPWGIEGLAAGVVAGAFLHLAVQLPGLVRERMRYRLTLDWRNPDVREVARLMAPRVVGLAAAQVNFIVTVYFASKIAPGAISNLTFAWSLAILPLGLFGMAISTAVFPTMADQAAGEEREAMQRTLSRSLRAIMFLSVPAALGLALLAEPIAQLVLQRGEFTSADTSAVAGALAFYCIGIVPMAGIEIHSRGFYALSDTRTPVLFAVVAMLITLVLSALLWDRHGLEGLAFAVSAAAWVEWLG
ncbi:MAG TPA: murein biosynthesis integral membrane protein MurJ, partial [Tepidiformaceae bacterium]|nr:murein biosynthesis integral membrane protein MurJ [Tepidiformaceae bacterium]